jgi:hypothetical protein
MTGDESYPFSVFFASLQPSPNHPLIIHSPSTTPTHAQMTAYLHDWEDSNREARLRKLILAVQQNPFSSLTWRRAMNRLLLEIQQLPGLAKSTHPDYPEVLNDALMRLGKEIQEFEPRQPSLEKSLTAWINGKLRLKYEVKDLHASPQARRHLQTQSTRVEFRRQVQLTPLSLDAPLNHDVSASFGDQLAAPGACTIWELEEEIYQVQQHQQRTRIGLRLSQYIQDDPESKLRQCHPQAFPQCHCQMLSQRLLLKHPPDRMANLAREFNINYHTLNWHWKNRGLPLLQTIAKNLGYQPDRET